MRFDVGEFADGAELGSLDVAGFTDIVGKDVGPTVGASDGFIVDVG